MGGVLRNALDKEELHEFEVKVRLCLYRPGRKGGKFVSTTHRPTLLSGNTPGNHFC